MMNLALSLVVISDADGCLLDARTYSSDAASGALEGLREHGVPLVLCSSKTRGELEALRARLGLDAPFICENGGAVYVPDGYFPFEIPGSVGRRGYRVLELGGGYDAVAAAVRGAAKEAGVELLSFADMTAADIARDTGLTGDEAVLAKQREYDEPFRLKQPDAAGRQRFERQLHASGVSVIRGGRYDHAVIGADKGKAALALRQLYEKAHGPVTTMGLGDALNDVSLLRAVDLPVVVRSVSEQMTRDVRQLVPWAPVSDAPGPAGWQAAVSRALARQVRLRRRDVRERVTDLSHR